MIREQRNPDTNTDTHTKVGSRMMIEGAEVLLIYVEYMVCALLIM